MTTYLTFAEGPDLSRMSLGGSLLPVPLPLSSVGGGGSLLEATKTHRHTHKHTHTHRQTHKDRQRDREKKRDRGVVVEGGVF